MRRVGSTISQVGTNRGICTLVHSPLDNAADWAVQLEKVLKKDNPRMPFLSAVIDSAGGDLMSKVNKVLKPGGRVVVYGMCVLPRQLSCDACSLTTP